jgi:hypothetical protein
MNLFMTIYVGKMRPFKGRFRNNLEILNDFAMTNLTLMMMFFTEWVIHPPAQLLYGTAMIVATSCLISLNMSIVIWTSLKTLRLIYVKYKNRLDHWRENGFRDHN